MHPAHGGRCIRVPDGQGERFCPGGNIAPAQARWVVLARASEAVERKHHRYRIAVRKVRTGERHRVGGGICEHNGRNQNGERSLQCHSFRFVGASGRPTPCRDSLEMSLFNSVEVSIESDPFLWSF